ncbi:MAG TPA: DUF3501 family protein [Polyangiaceae bacterium]|nr:DUF3501 family protein [Polyangiaceae bacterium]
MKPIERSELLDLGAYEQLRERFRARVIAVKRPRYVALGPAMTVLFENRDTVLFQVQEMLRTERITQEKAIQHELETYNELIPSERELSATIFIEYPDKDERERMLVALAGVEDDFYLLAGNERFAVIPDRRGSEPDRTMAVQYVKFPLSQAAVAALVGGSLGLKLGVEHPAYRAETTLAADTLASLRDDFA